MVLRCQIARVLTLVMLCGIAATSSFAQDSRRGPRTSGYIDLDSDKTLEDVSDGSRVGSFELQQEEKQQQSPYGATQDEAIAYVASLREHMGALERGEIKAIPEPSIEGLEHIAWAYLLCSLQRGACPEFLATILEIDFINSRSQKKAECRNMRRFWGIWLKNEMQKGFDQRVRTGFIVQVRDFREKKLPRFLRCAQTIEKESLLGNEAIRDAEFFQKRYANKKEGVVYSVERTLAILKLYKEKVGNLAATANSM